MKKVKGKRTRQKIKGPKPLRHPTQDEYMVTDVDMDVDVEDLLDKKSSEGKAYIGSILNKLRNQGHAVSRLVLDTDGNLRTEAHSETFEKLRNRGKRKKHPKEKGKAINPPDMKLTDFAESYQDDAEWPEEQPTDERTDNLD